MFKSFDTLDTNVHYIYMILSAHHMHMSYGYVGQTCVFHGTVPKVTWCSGPVFLVNPSHVYVSPKLQWITVDLFMAWGTLQEAPRK